ncbi:class I SAM-dependent methyltransferase [Candidatus Magnetaquicoccus inordinatus]|uniref:class I SAM-dependent methyltransferase n=1 Tax=Candidatus Magnetaquicoccus inordinatus TaxID=2496818 RepID=UPI00102CDBB4|nr:class I SAM-dependent methyltransferase [Candidatus Magnetaquicoccus inordinatus]
MNLWSAFLSHQDADHPTHKWKYYFPVYERYFQHFIYKPLTFLEIGCWRGASTRLWKRYFGPHATIIGVDINPACKAYEEDQIHIRIGAQQDTQFLQSLLDEFGVPDIVLDDGSHMMSHVTATFEFLYPRMAKNGIYMVEDLHTAYWQRFEGGLRRPTTFIEKAKGLIDEMHAHYTQGGALLPTNFTHTTMSVCFYDSMVVFEKCAAKVNRGISMPASYDAVHHLVLDLLYLDKQSDTAELYQRVRLETDGERLLQANERLLQQGQLRPAYVIAMVLAKSGREHWNIAFSLAAGEMIFRLPMQWEYPLQELARMSDGVESQQREEYLRERVRPILVPFLQRVLQQRSVEYLRQIVAITQACIPDLQESLSGLESGAAGEESQNSLLAQAALVLQRLQA